MSSLPSLGKSIRADFPFYQKNSQVTFLDSAASSLTPQKVIDAIEDYYANYSVNIHRGMYQASLHASQIYEETRQAVNTFINGQEGQTVFTRNTTESLNLLSYSLEHIGFAYGSENYKAWQTPLQKDDVILLSESEHHANIVPWHLLRQRKGVVLEYIPIKQNGSLDLDAFENLKNKLENKTLKIVSLAAVSNVSGVIHNLTPFQKYARQKGALFIIDAAQSICHLPTDVKKIDADFIAFSGHKMLAATGIGVLWGKKELMQKLPPFLGGGGMIEKVTKEDITYDKTPFRLEAGTPHIAGVFSLRAAIRYLQEIGLSNIEKHEYELILKIIQKGEAMGLRHFGPSWQEIKEGKVSKVGVYSFAMPDVHHNDLASVLDEEQVAIRVGHHCCQLFMQAMEVSGTARASLYVYNDEDDIMTFFRALTDAQDLFTKH